MAERRWFKNGLTGWHVLAMFCCFFGAVFVVSGVFLYFAQTSYPGNVAGAYQRGLKYNQVIVEADRQTKLGWKVSAAYRDGRLVVALADKDGRPLQGERVNAQISRPATSRFDRNASLDEHSHGTYTVPVALEAGYWDVAVRVNEGSGETAFAGKLRLWIGDRQ